MEQFYLMAGANLLLALLVIGSCVCRLGASSALTVRRTVRIKYVAILSGATASAIAPLAWSEYPGWGTIGMMTAVLVSLVVEMSRWRYGAPPDVRIDSASLELGPPETEKYHVTLMQQGKHYLERLKDWLLRLRARIL